VTGIALANKGAVVGQPENGDTATITFSKTMKASTFCSSWSNTTTLQTLTGVTLEFTDNGSNDTLSVTGTPCSGSTTFRLGTISTGGDYTSSKSMWTGSTIVWDPKAAALTLTLGARSSGNVRTESSPTAPQYTPATGITDLAGNALPTTTFVATTVSRF
jgi:hypothetical protein